MVTQLLDNRYQIVRVLGGGTFGQTFLAQDIKRPGHPECVVKQLRYLSNDPQSLQIASRLFKQEAEILEKLGKHPQIPTLLADIEENQEFYLVQEFIDGHPLTDEIIPGQPWNEDQIINLLVEILKILEYVHEAGVIHRDIKPENLMRRKSDNQIFLIDFGAVKELRTQIAQGQMNQTVAIGTPGYMPIEQFHGQPQFNSDIYAVGMIAIQALLGIDANDLQQLMNPNTNQVIWRKQRQVKAKLANVIDKMLCPGYQRRYQSVKDVLADLEKLVISSGIKTTSVVKKTQPNKKLNLILVGVAALTVFVGIAVFLYSNQLISWYFYNQGREKAKNKDYQGAIEDYTQAIRFNPNYAEAYARRCRNHSILNDNQKALGDCNQAISLDPNLAISYLNRGSIYSSQGEKPKAIADFTQAINLDSNLDSAFHERGLTRFHLGEYRGAIEDYSAAIKINSNYTDAYAARCGAYSLVNEYQTAIDDCTAAINLNPKYAVPYSNRGASFLSIGKNQDAIDDLTKAIQLDPNNDDSYLNRSLAKFNLQDYKGAIEDLNQALKRSPNNPTIYSNRGIVRHNIKDDQGAIEDLNQAIQIRPDYAQAYANRGLVYKDLGDKQAAIKDFQEAAKLFAAKGLTGGHNDAQYQLKQLQKP